MELITIGNKGSIITETNYWDTSYNKQGVLYLSSNAGAFRLLIPDGQMLSINDMLTAKTIIISSGPGLNRSLVFEILFDDNTDNPYVLHFGPEQVDIIPDAKDNKKVFRFIAYKKGLIEVINTKCGYRSVNKIPCLKPWPTQIM